MLSRLSEDLLHSAGLVFVGDVDVGLHGLVAGVAGPFHDGLDADAGGEGGADEGAAGRVGRETLPFGQGLLDTLAADEPGTGHGRVDSAHFTELFDVDIDRV